MKTSPVTVTWREISAEPFRLFFPAAVLVGIGGVLLWPLYFTGVIAFYPGLSHARTMAYGFFGGFIAGFLGTSLPRMLSVPALTPAWINPLFAVYLIMSAAALAGRTVWADSLFLTFLGLFALGIATRARQRQDLPPPGFVLVALGLGCAAVGAVLSLILPSREDAFVLAALQHLLAYQGFVLLPILGVGAFLLPRFFGADSQHDFPESRRPPAGWLIKAGAALGAGLLILGSFWIEASGWVRTGPALRLVVAVTYLGQIVPFLRAAVKPNVLANVLRVAMVMLLAGFGATVFWPAYRVSLLHLTLVGGFAMITFAVATRVVYGHSGNMPLLSGRNRWLWVATGTMLLAMTTRISGDFWPKVLSSHYSYGGVLWSLGVLIWAAYVLPKVWRRDAED